jgi:threonine synthase
MKTRAPRVRLLDSLVCSKCGKLYSVFEINTYANCCDQPLVASYDLSAEISKDEIAKDDHTMWRYFKFLPVTDKKNIVSLGEGMTPVIRLNNLAQSKDFPGLFIKDEGNNPTGSFKARGISAAVSKAKELGIDKLIVPTAGNAGGALAAYAAKANMKCIVVMPDHTPGIFKKECELYGADLVLVKGLINDCAKKVNEIKKDQDYFDVSTLKEPYRLEGKKTMGYEIAEQFNWQLPDVIIYPAGGGTGLIGIWKAFKEMLQLGWITGPLPRMVAVQAENCAPLAAAIKDPLTWKEHFSPAASLANGLAVPYPFGMRMMQEVISGSGGEVVTISEIDMLEGIKDVAASEGILLSPEGSAAWKGFEYLLAQKKIRKDETVLILNTGSGYKYLENLDEY